MTDHTAAVRGMLASLRPALQPGRYAFVTLPPGASLPTIAQQSILATFREHEGMTLVIDETVAARAGIPVSFSAAWIVVQLASQLDAVGLTAALSSALADAGIACNVIAAVHHDHLFVPFEAADRAMATLLQLQRDASDLSGP